MGGAVNFTFDEDQELLRASVRALLEMRSPRESRRAFLEAPRTFEGDLWEQGAAQGWCALLVPEDLGGASVSSQPLVDAVILFEELGRVLSSAPLLGAAVAAEVLSALRALSGDAGDLLLRRLAAGDEVLGVWLGPHDALEPDEHGPSLVGGRLEGEVSFVHDALEATTLLVVAPGPDGPHLVGLPTTAPGVSSRTLGTLDLTRRHDLVRFDDVEVESSWVLASGHEVARAAARGRQVAAVLSCAEAVGAAEALVDETLEYARSRVQFGRTIGSFQAIKHRLADLLIELEAMRAATHHAAMSLADRAEGAAESVAVAASFVPEAFCSLAGECLQLHGGIGFTWEHDCHLFVRRARTDLALWGSPEEHREVLCGLLETQHLSVDA